MFGLIDADADSLVGLGLTLALFYNTLAALVAQHGPIENNFKTLDL